MMYLPSFFSNLDLLLQHRGLALPAAMASFVGLAGTFFWGSLRQLRHAGTSETDALMNLSTLGTLRCICGPDPQTTFAEDRRQFCRGCGLEVTSPDASLLEKNLSRREIERRVVTLRVAAIRARNVEVPPSVRCIEDLNAYLASDDVKPLPSLRGSDMAVFTMNKPSSVPCSTWNKP